MKRRFFLHSLLLVACASVLLIHLAGGKPRWLFILVGLTSLALAWRDPVAFRTHVVAPLGRFWTMPLFAAYVSGAVVAVALANRFHFGALDGTLWDLAGSYLQPIYLKATTGHATMLFTDTHADALSLHFTPVIPLLAALYRVTGSLESLLDWQSFWLMAPGLVLVAGYLAVCRARGWRPHAIGATLAFSLHALSPTVNGQFLWPYLFHILGISLLALAYFFFYRGQWFAWVLCTLGFALQKDEFPMFTAAFAVTVLIDQAAFAPGAARARVRVQGLVAGVVVLAVSLALYAKFSASSALPFSSRFGNLGATPGEALLNVFRDPARYFHFSREPEHLAYFAFFLSTPFLFAAPRWRVWRFFFPFLPFLLLFTASEYPPMSLLKDHYALPLLVAACATLVYGWGSTLSRERWHLAMGASLVLSALFWGQANPFRIMKTTYRTWSDRSAERAIVRELKADPNTVLCCEGGLCPPLVERPRALVGWQCGLGSELLTEWKDVKSVVYVMHTFHPTLPGDRRPGLAYAPYPTDPKLWPAETAHFHVSVPIPVVRP